jgi:hypothetical protein
LLAAVVLAVGCDPGADQPPAAAPTNVTQNNYYSTNVYTAALAVPTAEPLVAPPPVVVPPEPPPPPPTPPPPPAPPAAPRTLQSTGIAECDAYLTRVEACSTQMLDATPENQAALGRIRESLDLTRRNWRRAAAGHLESREMLVDGCMTSMKMFNDQAWPSGTCR